MKRILFIGNTPYQILLSTWIKYHYYPGDKADIIIHDRLRGYERVKANIEKLDVFERVIVQPNHYKKTKLGKVKRILKEYKFARDTFKNQHYDEMYFANFDFSSQRIYDFLKRTNHNLLLNYFEDGIVSYSTKVEYFFNRLKKQPLTKVNHESFKIKYHLCDGLNRYCLFTPELLEWKPAAEQIFKIDSIDRSDDVFKTIINTIFDYDSLEDRYDKKYIFFEESYFQDTCYMEDVELIEELAEIVGKNNLMIKIHPRNQINRFQDLGYQTNKNTVIPWEVLALNLDLDNIVLLTIASSSITNPTAMFGCNTKAYSLMNCLNEKPQQLNSDYSKTVLSFFNHFDNVILCNNVKEIVNNEY